MREGEPGSGGHREGGRAETEKERWVGHKGRERKRQRQTMGEGKRQPAFGAQAGSRLSLQFRVFPIPSSWCWPNQEREIPGWRRKGDWRTLSPCNSATLSSRSFTEEAAPPYWPGPQPLSWRELLRSPVLLRWDWSLVPVLSSPIGQSLPIVLEGTLYPA